MPQVPQELLDVYAEIVRAAPDAIAAKAHLLNLLIDADAVVRAIADAIAAAQQRAQNG